MGLFIRNKYPPEDWSTILNQLGERSPKTAIRLAILGRLLPCGGSCDLRKLERQVDQLTELVWKDYCGVNHLMMPPAGTSQTISGSFATGGCITGFVSCPSAGVDASTPKAKSVPLPKNAPHPTLE